MSTTTITNYCWNEWTTRTFQELQVHTYSTSMGKSVCVAFTIPPCTVKLEIFIVQISVAKIRRIKFLHIKRSSALLFLTLKHLWVQISSYMPQPKIWTCCKFLFLMTWQWQCINHGRLVGPGTVKHFFNCSSPSNVPCYMYLWGGVGLGYWLSLTKATAK